MSSPQDKIGDLIFVGFVTVGFVWGFCSTIWGDGARKTFQARMHPAWRWLLMPTKRDRDEEHWIRMQKTLAWISLPFVIFIVTMILIGIFKGT